MTDALINGHAKPPSMNYEALKKRAQRAGVPVAVQRERERDMGLAHVPRGTSNKAARSPPRDIRLATSRDGPPSDISRDNKAMSLGTKQKDQGLKLVPHPHDGAGTRANGMVQSPPLQPGQSPLVTRPSSRLRDSLLRACLYLTSLLLATAGLGSNASYTFSQGRDLSEYVWLGSFAVGMEVATMILPIVISRMWRQQNYGHAAIALLWLLFCGLAVGMAAAGFVERTFGDTAAARGKGAAQYADIDADLRSARTKRMELKFVPTTQAAVDAAQALVTTECWRKRDSAECTLRRNAFADLSGRMAASALDDKLAGEIARLQAALAKAPSIANAADPQIEGLKGVVSQVSRHSRELDPGDVKLMRIFWFAGLPMLAGLMAAWADAIGEPRERKRVVTDDGFRNRSPSLDSNLAGQVA